MDQQFHNKQQLLTITNKQASLGVLFDQKNFNGHMFSIKLEENSNKMSFKALPVKIQWSKNQQGRGAQCTPTQGR